MIVSSFKPNNMIFSDPGLIPNALTIENYISGWKGYAGVTWTWDDFFNHLLYLTNPQIFSVSRALRTFVGDSGTGGCKYERMIDDVFRDFR